MWWTTWGLSIQGEPGIHAFPISVRLQHGRRYSRSGQSDLFFGHYGVPGDRHPYRDQPRTGFCGTPASPPSAIRSTLAEIGKRLGRKALAQVACVAKPDTILAWRPKLIASQSRLQAAGHRAGVETEPKHDVEGIHSIASGRVGRDRLLHGRGPHLAWPGDLTTFGF